MAGTMEDQLLQLLADTQLSAEAPRKQAELHLQQAESNPAFPASLSAIASHSSVSPAIRQSALSVLRAFVEKNWGGLDEDGNDPTIPIADATKEQLRAQLLELAMSTEPERKVRTAASYVVSKIANVDFPEQWPTLLPAVLHIIPNASDSQLHGALKVLADLVSDSLSEDQFFSVARDIFKVVYDVAINENRKSILRALAVSVFRACFDILDMVKDEHGPEVKGFADEILSAWSPFFMEVLKKALPARPKGDDEGYESSRDDAPEVWRGIVALKLQVVKTLMKIRSVFPKLLLPQTPALFSATWEELSSLQEQYQDMYVDNEEQGRLEDADGLPYTLDFLVLEELDFFASCLRAPPVQKELEAQLKANGSASGTPWITDVMKLAIGYAQIAKDDEGLWQVDVNLFIQEETSVSTNYTARNACGDLLIKLGEWLHQSALEGLLAYAQPFFSSETATWRTREASMFLLTQLLTDFLDLDSEVAPEVAVAYVPMVDYAINHSEDPLLKARGFLVAGILVQSLPELSNSFLDLTIKTVGVDESELVRVACIKALQGFIKASTVLPDRQGPIIAAISDFVYAKDFTDFAEDINDILVTLVDTVSCTIDIDPLITINGESGSLDLLFILAKHGAANFQTTMLVIEAFDTIASALKHGEEYTALCGKVLPTLTGAFDVGNMTQDDPLVEFAADLLSVLTEHGSEPLPPGYVAATMPKLNRLLMATNEGGILRPGVGTIKYMLMHDHQQVFAWHDENNRSGLEVCLFIIDRLLGPTMEDNSASEVGGLAAELVEKAGQERLGPYLEQLLTAVATRLATAEAALFVQSLILVFTRLALVGAQDVVEFLSRIEINGQTGLQVVLSKWLESSVIFTGYDEIRQNVIALSKIYELDDPRVAQTMIKGDLIIPVSNKIMTRSRAKFAPDQYTIVNGPVKIIKVLIQELLSASGILSAATKAAIAVDYAEERGDDDGWEDEPSIYDLALGTTKAELMSYGEVSTSGMRQADDETQAYLTEFFVKAASGTGFNEIYQQLTDEEKSKLNELAHRQ